MEDECAGWGAGWRRRWHQGASSCSSRVLLRFSSSPSLSSLPDVSQPPWTQHELSVPQSQLQQQPVKDAAIQCCYQRNEVSFVSKGDLLLLLVFRVFLSWLKKERITPIIVWDIVTDTRVYCVRTTVKLVTIHPQNVVQPTEHQCL